MKYLEHVSDEPLDIIEANECHTRDLTELATKRFRRLFNAAHALRRARGVVAASIDPRYVYVADESLLNEIDEVLL